MRDWGGRHLSSLGTQKRIGDAPNDCGIYSDGQRSVRGVVAADGLVEEVNEVRAAKIIQNALGIESDDVAARRHSRKKWRS